MASAWRAAVLSRSISREYFRALAVSLVTQLVSGVLAAIATDGGFLLRLWSLAMAGYWAFLILIVVRRSDRPTRIDLALVRWGFVFVLLLIVPLVSGLVWRLMS